MNLKFTNIGIIPSVTPHTMARAREVERIEEIKQEDKGDKLRLRKDDIQDLIDLKKDKHKKDKALAFLYRQIGMVLSLALVVIAFNWKTFEESAIMDLGIVDSDFDEIIEIPISEQPPPPPPQVESFTIKEVEDKEEIEEIEIALDVEMTEDAELEEVEYVAPVFDEVEEEVVDEIFTVVEEQSEPIGGNAAFQKYLAENIMYPSKAARLGIQGRVFVKFIVEKDGSLTDIQVVKGIGAGCDEEAIRVISEAPKWKPGKQRGKPVRTYRIIPINFVLKEN